MTVSSEISEVSYDTDGVTTSFPVPFYFLANDHLRVWLFYEDTGVEGDLVLGSTFQVTGAGNPAGGTVTTSTAYPVGPKLRIERVVPITQETAYQRNDPFPERAHERALDKLTMICQQLAGFFGLLPGSTLRALLLGRNDVDGQGAYRARNNRIQDLADPKADQDAVNRRSMFSFVTEYVDKAIAGVVGGFGWFIQGFVGAVYRTFQDKMRDSISIKDWGAIGDGVADNTAVFQAAAGSGLPVYIPPGVYRTDPFGILADKSRLIGAGSEKVTLLINAVSNAPSIWGLASDIELSGVTIKINPAPIGEHDGLYSTGFTAGRYFYALAYAPIRGVYVHDVKVLRESDTNLVNSFTVIGDVSDVTFRRCKAVGGLSGIVCHWGPDQVGTYGQPITGKTFHPNNIVIDEFDASGAKGGWPVFISACYDVRVSNVRSDNCPGSVAIVAGDVGNRYAPDAIKDKILTGISVDGVYSDVTQPDALLLDGEGNYNGVWQRVPMRAVKLDNIALFASAGTTAAVAIARDVVGDVEMGTLTVRTGNFVTTGLELERSTGIRIGTYASNAANGYVVDRAKHVRIENLDLADPQATNQTTGNRGVFVSGNRYLSTLGAALSVGATTITIATAFSVRAYRGDLIRVNAAGESPAKYVTIKDEYVPNSGTNLVIAIEPADFSGASGLGIALDNLSEEVEINGGRIKGYPEGLSTATATSYHTRNLRLRRLLFEACHDRDIDVQRLDSFDIMECEFRAGGTRSQNGVNQTRAINMVNCRDFRIINNRLGNESRFYTYGLIYGDSNNVEGLVANNTFGVGLGIGGVDVSPALKAAGRDNVYQNNRQFGGGTVTPVLT